MNRLQNIQKQTETEPDDSLYMAQSQAELDEILKNHPQGEQLAVITHKTKGTARIFGWVDGKPKPISPVFPNSKAALIVLKAIAQVATIMGVTSLIEQMIKGNKDYEKAKGEPICKESDEEWIAQIPPFGADQSMFNN